MRGFKVPNSGIFSSDRGDILLYSIKMIVWLMVLWPCAAYNMEVLKVVRSEGRPPCSFCKDIKIVPWSVSPIDPIRTAVLIELSKPVEIDGILVIPWADSDIKPSQAEVMLREFIESGRRFKPSEHEGISQVDDHTKDQSLICQIPKNFLSRYTNFAEDQRAILLNKLFMLTVRQNKGSTHIFSLAVTYFDRVLANREFTIDDEHMELVAAVCWNLAYKIDDDDEDPKCRADRYFFDRLIWFFNESFWNGEFSSAEETSDWLMDLSKIAKAVSALEDYKKTRNNKKETEALELNISAAIKSAIKHRKNNRAKKGHQNDVISEINLQDIRRIDLATMIAWKQLNNMERAIMSALDYRLSRPAAIDIFCATLHRFGYLTKINYCLGKYLLCLSCLSPSISREPTTLLSCSTIALVRTKRGKDSWPEPFAKLTGINGSDLHNLSVKLIDLWSAVDQDPDNSKWRTIYSYFKKRASNLRASIAHITEDQLGWEADSFCAANIDDVPGKK